MSEQKDEIEVIIQPQKVIDRAEEMAKALKSIVERKPKKVLINNEQYLEFEDWQTLARFFSLTVRTFDSQPVEINGIKGAKSKAEVVDNKTGLIVGSAEAFCLYDEPNWQNKPFFQLASMSQTRAGAKALRNVLAWVAVFAGYKPTPAEEIIESEPIKKEAKYESKMSQYEPKTKPFIKDPSSQATEKQIGMIHKICDAKDFDYNTLKGMLKVEHMNQINKGTAGKLIEFLQKVDEFNSDMVLGLVGEDYLYKGG